MRTAPKLIAVSAALALTACSTSQVYGVYYNSGYSPAHPQLAATDGKALAIIRANPFPEDRDNESVLAAMQGRNPGYKLYFSQASRPEAKYDYKVILSFTSAGPAVVNPCLDTGPLPPAPRTGRVDIRADFCIGPTLLSEARGAIDGVQRADDKNLHRLIGDVLTDLMSDRYPDQSDRGCTMPDC